MNFLNKIKDMVGLNEPEYDDDYNEDDDDDDYHNYQQQQSVTQEEQNNRRGNKQNMTSHSGMEGRNKSNVIGMPGLNNSVAEVVVFEPSSFDEMPQAIESLRQRKTVVLNLSIMDGEEAQRAVDFVAGGTYAIDGHQERIGESIFLFTPSCVQVSTQLGGGHETHQTYQGSNRGNTPTPAWANQASRLAQ